jgi:hypothetical protein
MSAWDLTTKRVRHPLDHPCNANIAAIVLQPADIDSKSQVAGLQARQAHERACEALGIKL